MSIFDQVLSALGTYNLKQTGANDWRCNSPFRAGSDSNAFTITQLPDGSVLYNDHVSNEGGTLHQLATELGIETQKERIPIENSKKPYKNLADYAKHKGVSEETFLKAGWKNDHWMDAPSISFKTDNGIRHRLLDATKNPYIQSKGYKACWYGLKRAVIMANKSNLPLVLCNGEASVVVAQSVGIPACAINLGESHSISDELLAVLKSEYPTGKIIVAYDCDATGFNHGPKKADKLRESGYESIAFDLGLDDHGDLADYVKLHGETSMADLMKEEPIQAVNASKSIKQANLPPSRQNTPESPVVTEFEAISRLQNSEAELAVLASILKEKDAISELAFQVELKPTHFSNSLYGRIYEIMLAMDSRNIAIDVITLSQKIDEQGLAVDPDSRSFVQKIIETDKSLSNYLAYAEVVKILAARRNMAHAGQDILNASVEDTRDLLAVQNWSRRRIDLIVSETSRKELVSFADGMEKFFEEFEYRLDPKNKPQTISTGLPELDDLLADGGLTKGHLGLVFARSGHGKSTLLTNIARMITVDANGRKPRPLIYLALEMEAIDLLFRIVAASTKVPTETIHASNNTSKQEKTLIYELYNRAASVPLWMGAYRTLTIKDIENLIRRKSNETELDVVMLDYIQLVTLENSKGNKVNSFDELAQDLSRIASEYKIALIVAAQCNRNHVSRQDKRPIETDIRDASGFFNASDWALSVWDQTQDDPQATKGLLQLGLAKNRHGKRGNFAVKFIDESNRISSTKVDKINLNSYQPVPSTTPKYDSETGEIEE